MNFADIINNIVIGTILRPLTVLVVALAVVYFLWGVAKYIQKAGDEGEKEAGKNMMLYGVIALFVMVSVWGLVNVLKYTFRLTETPPNPPTFNVGG